MEKCLIQSKPDRRVNRRHADRPIPRERLRVGELIRGMDGIPDDNTRTDTDMAVYHAACPTCATTCKTSPHRRALLAVKDDREVECIVCAYCGRIVEVEPATAPVSINRECEFSI